MIKRNSSISMYEQIVGMLKEEIFQKKIAGGGCLGTQKELADKYDVSLITIRKALQVLEEQGIVEVKQGKGTFVSRNILANKYNFFSSYVDVLYGEDNSDQNTRLICAGVIDTPGHLPAHISKLLGEKCYMSEKVFTFEDKAAGQYISYIQTALGDRIEPEEIRRKTTYELFVEKCDIELGKGFQRIKAIAAQPPQTEIFDVPEGAPMIFIQRETYAKSGAFLELMEIYCEYSQYEYTASLDMEK